MHRRHEIEPASPPASTNGALEKMSGTRDASCASVNNEICEMNKASFGTIAA
jgi:hypothetical protein